MKDQSGRNRIGRRTVAALTELQLDVLDVLWAAGEATVKEVQAALEPERPLARTTVATLLSRLEKKGVVARRAKGGEYVYRPRLSRQAVRRRMLVGFVERVFGGDVPELMSQLLTVGQADLATLRRLRTLIEARREDLEGSR